MIGMRRPNGVTEALINLRPGAHFIVRNNSYDEIEWHSTDKTLPTREEIDAKIAELEAAEPMRVLREIRDWYLERSDWTQGYDIRQLRGEEWCAAWDAYRQALRDMPTTQTPYFDENNMIQGITWPQKPAS